jgi:hypothetical protein
MSSGKEGKEAADADMSLDTGDAKESKQELSSPFEDSDEWTKRKVSEIWTSAAVKDELTFQLSSAISFKIDDNSQVIHITHRYYNRADLVLYRINVYEPPPDFIINLSDISPKLRSQLEQVYKSSRDAFDRLVTEAVQSILESINQRYYHVSNITYKVRWRFEP